MKILHYADLHVTEGPRLEGAEGVLTFIEERAAAEKVDLVLCAGDLTNDQPRRTTPRERAILRQHFQTMGNIAPVVIVRGNHDYPRDWEFLDHLECKYGIRYVERAQVVEVSYGALSVKDKVSILAIPWPDRGYLADQVEGGRGDINEAIRQAMRGVLQGLEMESRGKCRVGLAHCNVIGTTIDNGQPLIGDDVELGAEDLAPMASLWCLGHIHKHQILNPEGATLVFAGAPMQHKHGAIDQRVICLHKIDYKTGALKKTEAIPTPYRALRTVDLWFQDAGTGPGYYSDDEATADALWVTGNIGEDDVATVVSDADVRVRVYYDEALADAFDRRAVRDRVLGMGAHSVKLEATAVATVKVRAPRIVEVQTLREKLDVFLEEKGKTMQEDAGELLAELLSMLETREPEDVLAYATERADALGEGLV